MGSGLINIGTQAMFASNAMLTTTANNISNAHTEGYSRQSVQLATEEGQYTGAGFMGRGVRVASVVRSENAFLTKEVNQNLSVAASDQARLDKLKQMEQVFPLGEAGLGYAATQFLNTFVDVANSPQDVSARQVSLARAGDVASRMSAAAGQLDTLQQGVLSDIRNSVASVNNFTSQIANVNQKLAALKGTGHEPNDLLDQRDQLVKQLNDIIAVSTVTTSDGTMSVFAAGGQNLVLGETSNPMAMTQDEFDPSKAQLSVRTTGGLRTLNPGMVTGGSLAGLLRVQNEDIPASRNRLGQMAAALSAQVNDQQGMGLWPGPPPDFGAAIFNSVPPQLLPSSANRSSLTVPPVSAALAAGQSAALQASDYRIVVDPSGAISMTRLSDQNTVALSAGLNTVDGMDITIDGATLQPGDRFELRPVGLAAANMRRVLDDPRGIAAASPFTATVPASNQGTVSVGSLTMTARPDTNQVPNSTDPLTVAFTSANGDYELRDPAGGVLASGTWRSSQPIAYNGFSMSLNGTPKAGDVVTVSATTYLAGNSGNALAMMGLRDRAMVGQQTLVGGGVVPGATLSDAYSNFIGDLGVNVQGAQTAAQISGTLASNSKEVLANVTGVNLDEEAARLIQFQQSYQAAAKIVQVAQSVFATLLQTAGG